MKKVENSRFSMSVALHLLTLATVPALLPGCEDEQPGCRCSDDGARVECYDPDGGALFSHTSADCSSQRLVCRDWAISADLRSVLTLSVGCVPEAAEECNTSSFSRECDSVTTYIVCEPIGDTGYTERRRCPASDQCHESASGGGTECIPTGAVEDPVACPEGSTGFCEDDQTLVVCFEGLRLPASSCASVPLYPRSTWYGQSADLSSMVGVLPEECVVPGKCVMLSSGAPGCVPAEAEPCDGESLCTEDGTSIRDCVLGWTTTTVACDDPCSAGSTGYDSETGAWTYYPPDPEDYQGRVCQELCADEVCLGTTCIHPE